MSEAGVGHDDLDQGSFGERRRRDDDPTLHRTPETIGLTCDRPPSPEVIFRNARPILRTDRACRGATGDQCPPHMLEPSGATRSPPRDRRPLQRAELQRLGGHEGGHQAGLGAAGDAEDQLVVALGRGGGRRSGAGRRWGRGSTAPCRRARPSGRPWCRGRAWRRGPRGRGRGSRNRRPSRRRRRSRGPGRRALRRWPVSLRQASLPDFGAGGAVARSGDRAEGLVLADDAHRLLQGRQEGEQVDQLAVGHGLGQAFGHQGDLGDLAVLDVGGADDLALAVGGLEDDPVGRLLDDQAGQDPAVGQGQDVRLVVVADRRARVEDRAEQLVLAVLGADRREVGADPLPLPLDPVAGGAGVGGGALGEDGSASIGVARCGGPTRGSAARVGRRRQSWAAAGVVGGLAADPARRRRCGRSRSPRS